MSQISSFRHRVFLFSCIALSVVVSTAWAQVPQEAVVPSENGHTENGHTEVAPVSEAAVPAKPTYDEAALFQKVFGKKETVQKGNRKLIIPVVVDDQPIGSVAALLSMDGSGEARFDFLTLAATLEPVLLAEHVDALKSRVDKLGYISTKDFADLGWRITLDQSRIAAKVEAPIAFRKTQEGSLRSRRPTPYGQRIEPAAVSAYVNLSAAQDFRTGLPSNNGRQPMALNMTGAANVKSLVIEGGANYQESAKRRWVRNDLRLVKDWQEKAVRFSFGDLSYSTGGLQSAPAVGGFSMARNFSLRPYDVVQSSGTANFVLETESRVEFYVNGQFIEAKDLPAGPHRLSDFPVSTGANDITLRIRDKFGKVKEILIPFFYSSTLLGEGVNSFSYNVGYLTENRQGVHHYNTKIPVYSMNHSYGLTSEATVGVNAQGSKHQTQVGGEALFATLLGNFQFRGAASQSKGNDPKTLIELPSKRGYASTIQYDLLGAKDDRGRALTLQWAKYTSAFTSLGQLIPVNPITHRFTGRYSQEIYDGLYGALSGAYALRRDGTGRENSQTISLNRSFEHGLTATMDLTRARQPRAKLDERLMVGIRWSIPNSSHTLSGDYQSQHHAKRVRWNYGSSGGVGSFASTASLMHQEGTHGGDASLSYTANRAQGSVLYERTNPDHAPSGDRTSLNLSTALVFADGHVAVSRPVSDSFVIVAPHATLADKEVRVNPSGDRYAAKNDILGAAVVPDVLAYNVNSVAIDGSEIPAGYEVGNNAYYVESTYKRGAVLKIGSDATVMVKGQLLEAAQKPISLASGQIMSVEEPEREPILFFTNRNGYFAAEGLKPGHYKVVVYGDVIHELSLDIPKGTTGIYSINAQQMSQADERMKMIQEDNT